MGEHKEPVIGPIKEDDYYYPAGMWGQQTTRGRTVLEELTARNVAALITNTTFSGEVDYERIVKDAIIIAKETVHQLNKQ